MSIFLEYQSIATASFGIALALLCWCTLVTVDALTLSVHSSRAIVSFALPFGFASIIFTICNTVGQRVDIQSSIWGSSSGNVLRIKSAGLRGILRITVDTRYQVFDSLSSDPCIGIDVMKVEGCVDSHCTHQQ